LRRGVRDYISKPFDIKELLASIDWALTEGRLRREKERLLGELQVANETLRQRMRDLVTLQAVGRSVASLMPRDQVLQRILDAAQYLTGADASVVFLVDAESGELRLEAVRHARGYASGLDSSMGDSYAADVLCSGQPLYLSQADRRSGVTGYLGMPARSLLYVPISAGDVALGVLGVASVQPDHTLPAETEGRLTALADYVAIALNNSHLYETVEQRAGQLATVNRIAHTVVSSLDLDTVVSAVVREIRNSMRAETATLVLLDEDRQDLVFDLVLGDEARPADSFSMKVGQGIVGWVVEHGQPARVDDVSRDPRFFDGIDDITGFSTHSILCVPLVVSDRIIGAIEAINKLDEQGHPAAFMARDEELLQGAAAFVSLAVENSRLHAAMQEAIASQTLHEAVVTLSHHVNNPLQALMGAAEQLRLLSTRHGQAGYEGEGRLADLVEAKVREISIVLSILRDMAVPESTTYLGGLQMIDIEAELGRRLEAAG
jgi:GAF domain-containing protein